MRITPYVYATISIYLAGYSIFCIACIRHHGPQLHLRGRGSRSESYPYWDFNGARRDYASLLDQSFTHITVRTWSPFGHQIHRTSLIHMHRHSQTRHQQKFNPNVRHPRLPCRRMPFLTQTSRMCVDVLSRNLLKNLNGSQLRTSRVSQALW